MAVLHRCKVAGVTRSRGYPDNVLRLGSALDVTDVDRPNIERWAAIDAGTTGVRAFLWRDPDNEVDGNAIEVHVPMLGRWGILGWVPREVAPGWAARLDRGEWGQSRVVAVLVTERRLDYPGVEIEVMFHDVDCPLSLVQEPLLRRQLACVCTVEVTAQLEMGFG